MKRIIFAISLVCALATTACTDLTEKVYSSLTQSSYNYSPSDLRPSVDACYAPMRSFIGHTNLWALDCTCSDEICQPPNSTGWDDGGIYRRMHYHTWNSEQVHVSNLWSTLYQGIGLCNSLIAQLENNDLKLDEATNKKAIAEVKTIRAYYYSVVCDNWSNAPLVKEISQTLPTNAARTDVYKFVVDELAANADLLPTENGGTNYGHFTKWAAKTLLAKMYLNAEVYTGTANYSGAETVLDEIIGSGQFQLSTNYKDNFVDSSAACAANKELIFSIPFDTALGSYSMYFFSWGAPVKKAFNTGGTPWGSGSAMGVPQFIDTYDADDCRLKDSWLMGQIKTYKDGVPNSGDDIYCIYDAKGGSYPPLCYENKVQSGHFTMEWEGYRMGKFEVPAGTNGMSADQPVFRYAEVLLMKAECMLRQDKAGAATYVNQVRARAFKANPAKATVTDADLKANSKYKYYYYASDYAATTKPGDQTAVKFGGLYDEYGWEFAWELGTRTRMIRFGTFDTKSWLSHEPQGKKIKVYPIPFSALTANTDLKQNPDYE